MFQEMLASSGGGMANVSLTPSYTGTGAASGYPYANAFDGNNSTYFAGASNSSIIVVFGGNVKIKTLNMNTVDLNTISIQYSDDGTNYTALKTANITNGDNVIDVSADTAHKYWKILNTSTLGNCHINECSFEGTYA